MARFFISRQDLLQGAKTSSRELQSYVIAPALTPSFIVITIVIGYLIGSIPFAYLVTRAKTGLDLRREGTGNIGTANAFDVTGSKRIGIVVLICDVMKGMIPIVILATIGQPEAILFLLPALILGHCYPVWLRFHGGRGLATVAGAALCIAPVMVIVWLLVYSLARKIKDQVHFGAIVATTALLGFVLLLPAGLVSEITLGVSGLKDHPQWLSNSVAMAIAIILTRHIEPLFALVRHREPS